MSNPIVCNRSPGPGDVGGVDTGARFSVRAEDSLVSRATVYFHIGAGPAFYPGGILPQDHETVDFNLETKFFSYTDPAEISVDGGTGELIIEKLLSGQSQAATYFFGGLQSPADPESPIMLEFTLKLQDADVQDVTIDPSDDQHQLAGPECGFFIGNTGATVRFMRDSAAPGGNRWVELHDGRSSAPGPYPPVFAPLVMHDWDQGQAWTYKLLWHPRLDLLKLYVSTGQDALTTDILLVDGKVSDVTPIPAEEFREHLPVAFFGHGSIDSTSTSRWANAYLYNLVTTPTVDGIFPGNHTGVIQSNNVTHYRGDALPRDVLQPWTLLPNSFGTVDGKAFLVVDKLTLVRGGTGTSYGYYRLEPTIGTGAIVFDFKLNGLFRFPDRETVNTGMEVFIDDGTKVARFCLLYSGETQYVGILVDDSNPELISSYLGTTAGWSTERSYRMIFEPGVSVRVMELATYEGIYAETLLAESSYTFLPDTRDPSGDWTPSIGFSVNGTDNLEHDHSMQFGRLRYVINSRLWEGYGAPISPWVEVGTGSATSETDELYLVDESDSEAYYFKRLETYLSSVSGVTIEFKVKVDAYEVDSSADPIRTTVGVGVSIDDGSYQTMLVFAEGGPELGKIMFLATMEDLDDNLLAVRAADEDVEGTYAGVNWSEYRTYRIEKTDGVGINVYVDDSPVPSISFGVGEFSYPPTLEGAAMVRFGNMVPEAKNSSYWRYLRYSVSEGVDIAAFPVLSRNEVLARFDHAVNVIVEAGDSLPVKTEFSGAAALFNDPDDDPYEAYESGWIPYVRFTGGLLVEDYRTGEVGTGGWRPSPPTPDSGSLVWIKWT